MDKSADARHYKVVKVMGGTAKEESLEAT